MYAVRGALVRVFVPEYHVRGVVHLADRDGVALPPPASRVRRSPEPYHSQPQTLPPAALNSNPNPTSRVRRSRPPAPPAAPGTVLSPAPT